jgi:hypothetical protein
MGIRCLGTEVAAHVARVLPVSLLCLSVRQPRAVVAWQLHGTR